MSLKKMDLVPQGDNQFKIDDTNTLLHYTATVDGQAQDFPSEDPCFFQIKNKNGFVQTAKATVSGTDIVLNSKDIANLPVGNYELELWHMNRSTGNNDIFPDYQWLPFTINENATGQMGSEVTTITLKQLQDTLEDTVNKKVEALVADAKEKIAAMKPEPARNGTNATITISDTKQVAANEKPGVTNLGTDTAAILEFKIPVGAIKTMLLDTKDLNEVKTSGYYTGNAMTIANAPSTGQFIVKVVSNDDDTAVQLYYDLRRNEQYMRTMYAGKWNEWRWQTLWY